MTKEFAERVIREGIVDTNVYRYISCTVIYCDQTWMEIRRIRLEYLDRTTVYTEWETMKVIR